MTRHRRALITGITGQDGSYLAELLLLKGYEVHGLIRRASTFNTARIGHLYDDPHDAGARLFLHYGDLTDGSRLVALLAQIRPDEVYHLAAQSHVRVSFDEPSTPARRPGWAPPGCSKRSAWSGSTAASTRRPHRRCTAGRHRRRTRTPRSTRGRRTARPSCTPTGSTRNYREAYGMFAVNGILFNHESPRRARRS